MTEPNTHTASQVVRQLDAFSLTGVRFATARRGALFCLLLGACSNGNGTSVGSTVGEGASGSGTGGGTVTGATTGGDTTGNGMLGSGDASVASGLDGGTGTSVGVGVGGQVIVNGTGGGGAVTVADVIAASEGALPGGGKITLEEGENGEILIVCGTAECQCADGIDNDGDGTGDGLDGECTGPFDDDEGTFATGIPGDNQDPKWQDCFFDGNSGAGDDGCRYHTDCLTGEATVESDPDSCEVSDSCIEFCAPLTPPGCDCFGCCSVETADLSISVVIGASCTLEDLQDETKCPVCVPTEQCQNTCDECELCVGKGPEDLPASCATTPPPGGGAGMGSGGGTPSGGSTSMGGAGSGGSPPVGGMGTDDPPPRVCDRDAALCTVNDECTAGEYCGFGCCTPFIR